MDRPFSQACDNNKGPILDILQRYLANINDVLEVGSGTGQHAVHFAKHLPHLTWQTSDQRQYLQGIQLWIEWSSLPNLPPPIELDVCKRWSISTASVIYSANTVHIMNWDAVEKFIFMAGSILSSGGLFILYGPFNYNGRFTSDSNLRFDQWLKDNNSGSGIRDFEAVNRLAMDAGLILEADYEMPANNKTLIWKKL